MLGRQFSDYHSLVDLSGGACFLRPGDRPVRPIRIYSTSSSNMLSRPTPAQRYLGSDTSLTLFWHDFPPGLRNMWFRSEYNPTKERAPWRRHQGLSCICRTYMPWALHNGAAQFPCSYPASVQHSCVYRTQSNRLQYPRLLQFARPT